jgi:hypothetical protein
MNINQHNYEAWLLDYIEGRLDAISVLMLKDFLHKNPHLGNFDDLTSDLPELGLDSTGFGDVSILKKQEINPFVPINESNYEQFFIAMHEGLLTDAEALTLKKFLAINDFLKEEYTLYGKIKLVPDLNIIYPKKSSLRRYALAFAPTTYRIMAVAASILLLLGISLTWYQPETTPMREGSMVAEITQLQATEIILALPEPALKESSKSLPEALAAINTPLIHETYEPLPVLAMKKASTELELNILSPSNEIQYAPWELQIDWEVFYANLNETDNFRNKSLVGLVLANTFDKARNMLGREPTIETEPVIEEQADPSRGFSLWDIASLGVKTYNTLTDRNVEFVTAQNENGDVVAYRFRSERLEIARVVERD